MTVPCVLLRLRDDVLLPFALCSHLHTSFLTICTDRSSKPTAPLALDPPPPRSRYGLHFTAAAIRCEVKKISTSSFPHRPHPPHVPCLSLYTFWLWWSRVASMYNNKLLMFRNHYDVHHIPGRIPPCCGGFVISRG
jgi:hypothetical protein